MHGVLHSALGFLKGKLFYALPLTSSFLNESYKKLKKFYHKFLTSIKKSFPLLSSLTYAETKKNVIHRTLQLL
jgi:hypothetical protein